MKFRADINGLRAAAVISVIIFHFNKEWVPGGFVGVDIFFVISGYLMTAIIFSGLQRGDFSILGFYLARGKRIIPALVLVCLVLFLFGYLFVIPKDLGVLSKHALSSVLFVSNIVYAGESGYFDADAGEKWLLHTWSLSVEWQFYLLYPIVLVVAARFLTLSRVKSLVAGGVFIGYAYCVYATRSNPTDAFFLLPARAWEMLVGGAAYLYPFKINSTGKRLAETAGWGAILFSCFFLSESETWPGYLALLPVLGAYLVIQADAPNSLVTTNFFAQKVGAYSYSLYLWHWPIIVAVGYLQINAGALTMLAMLMILIVLSMFSYQLVEHKRVGTKGLVLSSVIATGAAIMVLYSSGMQFRVTPEFQLSEEEYHLKYYGGAGYAANELIYIGSKKEAVDGVLVGDSFGHQYVKEFDAIAVRDNLFFSGLFDHGCLILPNLTYYVDGIEDKVCSSQYGKVISELKRNPEAPLILAYSWDTYVQFLGHKEKGGIKFDSHEAYRKLITDELAQFFRDGGEGRKYFLVGVPQSATTFAFRCLAQTDLIGSRLNRSCDLEEPLREMEINAVLSKVADSYENVFFINPNDALCSSKSCLVISDRKPIHSDRSHLSVHGAEIVVPYIVDKVGF